MEFSVKEVCEKLNISKDTLYYYESEGMLPPIKRNKSGYRTYSEDDVSWIYLIICFREIDAPIRLIKSYVTSLKDENGTIEQRKAMVTSFKNIIDEKLTKYKKIQALIDKKLEFYSKITIKNEELKCYDYRTEWEYFKNLLEENLWKNML